MFNKILTALLFIMFLTPSFAQLSKKDQKSLKKLKKQYDFVSLDNKYFSKPKNCAKIIVGDYLRGPSDGGGGYNKGIKNLKIVNLDGDVIKQINEFSITLPFGRDNSNYKYLIRTMSPDGLVGLMDNCGNIILQPTYNHINLFNKEGQAVGFSGNSIDVINSEGKSILTKKMPYKVNYKSFWTIPSPGPITELQVINGRIFVANENEKYAIYDIEKKTNITEYKYTYLSTKIFEYENKTYVKASISPYKTLVDIETGKELLPNDRFYDIDGTKTLEGVNYIRVVANEEPYNRNLFDLNNQKLLLPTNFKLWDVSGYIENKPNLLKLCGGVNQECGVFDFEKKAFLLEPQGAFEGIQTSNQHKKLMELNVLLISLRDNYTFEFFDLDTNSLLKLYISGKRMNISLSDIIEFSNGKKMFNARVTPSPTTATHYDVIYDENWNEIYLGNPNARVRFNKEDNYIKITEKSEQGNLKMMKIESNGEISNIEVSKPQSGQFIKEEDLHKYKKKTN